jgi:hypothetical protein
MLSLVAELICVIGGSLGELLQLRVLRFRFFQDGYVGVGVFPEGEEILVGGERRTRAASASEARNVFSNCADRRKI